MEGKDKKLKDKNSTRVKVRRVFIDQAIQGES